MQDHYPIYRTLQSYARLRAKMPMVAASSSAITPKSAISGNELAVWGRVSVSIAFATVTGSAGGGGVCDT